MPANDKISGSAIASVAKQMPRLQGLDTLGILTTLFKTLHNANEIPSENSLLRQCLYMQYGLSRNLHIANLLESPIHIVDTLKRTETALGTLEKLKKPSFYPHSKTFKPLEESLEKYKNNRDTAITDYNHFADEKVRIIKNVIERLKNAISQGSSIDLTHDQVILNELSRVDKMRTDILFKSQKLSKDKTALLGQAEALLHMIHEDIPPELRPGKEPTTTPASGATPRMHE